MKNVLRALIAVISVVSGIVSAVPELRHSDTVYTKSLSSAWSQELDNQARSLFRRVPGDGTNYAPVGTPGRTSLHFKIRPL